MLTDRSRTWREVLIITAATPTETERLITTNTRNQSSIFHGHKSSTDRFSIMTNMKIIRIKTLGEDLDIFLIVIMTIMKTTMTEPPQSPVGGEDPRDLMTKTLTGPSTEVGGGHSTTGWRLGMIIMTAGGGGVRGITWTEIVTGDPWRDRDTRRLQPQWAILLGGHGSTIITREMRTLCKVLQKSLFHMANKTEV